MATLFPRRGKIVATQMTPQALYHLPPGSLVHRFIIAGERSRVEDDERAEATRALREMLSAGKLTKLIPEKVDGRIETKEIAQDGPIAYIETTTSSRVFDEDANRCILLQTDERPDQTARIIKALAAGQQSTTTANTEIQARHWAIQVTLEPEIVLVPFADRLAELFPTKRVEARRAFGHLLSMIQASALLHQRQRQHDTDGNLLADADDYRVAKRLLDKPMSQQLGGKLPDAVRRFYDRLVRWVVGDFDKHDTIKHGENVDERTVNGWIGELHRAGYLGLVEPTRGNKAARWRLAAEAPSAETADLPSVESVFRIPAIAQSSTAQVAAG